MVLDKPKASRYSLEDLLNPVQRNTLLLLDRGFYHFDFWQELINGETAFIIRINKRLSYPNEQVLTQIYDIKDRIIKIDSSTKKAPIFTVRLVRIWSHKTWHSYLTSVLAPQILLPYVVAGFYQRGWQIESAFCTVKPLLNLSYLWTGSLKGVELQIWET